jgi:predicted dehydrogenase
VKNLRVALVGCGKMADQHMAAIKRIPNVHIVGVCDNDEMMAEQLSDRFGLGFSTNELDRLLESQKPDIVHITTPPQSHYELAKRCLDAGCHAYIEKPFALTTEETVRILNFAEKMKLKVTAGHNYQFTWENIEARNLVKSGYLGGRPIFIESYYSYNFVGDSYALALLGDKEHWVRKLPGKLLHNVISHAVARLAEFMEEDNPRVSVLGYTSPALRARGEKTIRDELRVTVFDKANTSALLIFTSQIKPPVNKYRLYGEKNSIEVDNFNRTIIRMKDTNYKSYARYFAQPLLLAQEYSRNTINNVIRFLSAKFHDDSGLTNLIGAFYDAVREQRPLPISYREIILTSRIMDSIFQQLDDLSGPE